MSWRKWFVRGLVFSIMGLCALGYLIYQRWTNPAAVREQVLAKLKTYFPGAQVTVDAARLRLLGGIAVNDVRLTRRDDPPQSDLAHIPTAILYHDKEKILDGQVTFRKVELNRPRIRLERRGDGSWNVQGLTAPLAADVAWPTLVIHQGTLVFEDGAAQGQPSTLELSDVQLTLINDPVEIVHITGSGRSALTGTVTLQGQWHRQSQELSLTVKAPQLPLSGALAQRLSSLCPAGSLDGLVLAGQAQVEARLGYQPTSPTPFSYDVRAQLGQAKLQHPRLPVPLENVHALVEASNGLVRISQAKAQSGATRLQGQAALWLGCANPTWEAHIDIRNLPLTEELFAKLPDKMKLLHKAFQPKGTAAVEIAVAQRDGQWVRLTSGKNSTITLAPEGLKVTFTRFPYPLTDVTGRVEMDLQTNVTQVEATGKASSRPVMIRGAWRGAGNEAEAKFDLHATDVPLNETMLAALPASFQKLARSFNAAGKADIKGLIQLVPGSPFYHNEFHVRFHDCAVVWDYFPYPLKQVTGLLDIYPTHCEFRDFKGKGPIAEVVVGGKLTQRDADAKGGWGLSLDIKGQEVPLDQDLHAAFKPMPQMARAWDVFQPKGKIRFHALIDRPDTHKPDMDVRLQLMGGAIEPAFFPYLIHDVAGTFRFRDNRLDIHEVTARHQHTKIRLPKGTVDLYPGGGYFADLEDLTVHDLYVDETLIRALPKGLQAAAAALRLKDPVVFKSRVVAAQGAEPGSLHDIGWDGKLWLNKATLTTGIELTGVTGILACRGRYNGRQLQGVTGNLLVDEAVAFKQSFKGAQAHFQIKENTPDVLLLGLQAPIYGGDIAGQLRLEMNSAVRYALNLTASQIDLAELGQHNHLGPKAKMSGKAEARLYLTGLGGSADTLDGNGSLDVRDGKLINLPLLLDLIKFLGLRWPDRTAFEEVHAQFAILGRRVNMRRLDLVGNAVSLSGQGEFNLDGTDLNLEFYPSWARVEQLLPASARPFPHMVSKNLMTIEMRGKIGSQKDDFKFHMRPLPAVFNPLMQVTNRAWEKN